MAQLISVKLARFDGSPWGFRLQGGKDFGTPLVVQKVNGGSLAEQAGLRAGDAVIRVNSTDTFNLRHKDAQDVIVRAGNSFEITVQRGGSTWRPSVSPVTPTIPSPQPSAPVSSVSPVTKTSLAARKQDAPHIGSGHNFTPKPFLNGNSEGPIKSIVNKQYNSPVGIYSEETIAETLSAQAEVLAGGVLGVNFKKNERNYNAENSEVFKMVQEADKEPKTPEPAEPAPHSGVITPSSPAIAGLRSVSAPETKPRPTTPQTTLPPGQNICADCERLIVGVFVRIKEKNLHVECFKCSTCGTSLKNVGYYNINNKLYCDIHAKLVARQQAPSGLAPITVPSGGKAPAGTISAALANLGGTAPLSPPLNSHGSPQPFSARNHRRSSGDLGMPAYCTPTTTTTTMTNGTSGYDDRDCYSERECRNAKTYTSTITIRTGNEVGRSNDRVNELVLDDNRNPTNVLCISRDNDATKRDNNVFLTSPSMRMRNGDDESRFILYDPVVSNSNGNSSGSDDDDRHPKQEPAVVNIRGVPRYQVTDQRLKSGTYSSYHPSNEDTTRTDRDDRTSEIRPNGREPNIGNRGYRSITQSFDRLGIRTTSLISPTDKIDENGTHSCIRNRTHQRRNGKSSESFDKNNRVYSGYPAMSNERDDFSTRSFLNDRTDPIDSSSSSLSATVAPRPPTPPNPSSPPPPPPLPMFPPSSRSWGSTVRPNRLGTPPVDTPSFRPVQSHTTNNIGGPKPFGGSTVFAPSSLTSPSALDSGNTRDTPSRPQSQTVTERYFEESDYYEAVEQRVENRDAGRSSSVKNKSKSLVWPPVKPIEDVTYPTASPIWIDPNPVLDKRPRRNVREKRTTLEESADTSRCGSRCGSRCCGGYEEEREYERHWSVATSSRVNDRETSMDRASCSQPFYRRVEVAETRSRECRAPVRTPRPSSADGVRRSLTPTRISQPIPRPWMATVTTGTSVYGHVEPPPEPECIRRRQTCECRIICERTSGPEGPEHEQRHTYREVSCELCRPTPPPPPPPCPVCPYAESAKPTPQIETDDAVVDLSKVVPPDVAVCPKGVESQHNLFTETMEKDVGDIHVKKTTIYEKTVQLMSPDRAASPEPAETVEEEIPEQQVSVEPPVQRNSTVTLDREVESISDRRTVVESAEFVASAIDTTRLMEDAAKENEAEKLEYERICREERERLRRQEEECQEQQRRYEEERARRKERKHVNFNQQPDIRVVEESCKPVECYQREQIVEEEPPRPTEERYRRLTEEIEIQENFDRSEDERRRSLREQVEVHERIREQQAPPEKRPSLQERRLCARFRDTPAERESREQEQQRTTEATNRQRKHVQFVTRTETESRPLPPTTIRNATAREWKSEMVQALTTAPACPYSCLDSSAQQQQQQQQDHEGETTSRTIYSRETRYEETCEPVPPPRREDTDERPVSPFQAALTTAPERPYTPLGREEGQGYDSVICVDRCQTPVDSISREGYCHPAEILYTDERAREARSREKNLNRVQGPRPLPTPPPDYRLRDSSASPARSLSRPGTPKDRSLMTGLKKPGTIPSYQRYLVSMKQEAVESNCYAPSPSPIPNRSESPAPACYAKAHAPRIRESPPTVCETTRAPPCQQRECVSYHAEEDGPSGHRAWAYHGVRFDDSQCDRESSATIAVQRQDDEEKSGCAIDKINRTRPSLPCPLAHCPEVSERFPKTGVRVLPPPPSVISTRSCETRRICHEEQRSSNNSCGFASSRRIEEDNNNRSNSGIVITACKSISSSGTKAGIVVVPSEDDTNDSESAGIRVTPTPDRSGVCVSPMAHGKSTEGTRGGARRSGGCTIDIGNCPASGVRVAACGDGSVCVAPCSIPGYSSVQCPKPIAKSPCPRMGLPYPQIPLPNESNEPVELCDGCPLQAQPADSTRASGPSNDQSFQPIREPRTNLGQQLTRLTVRRDKRVVQLYKPQAQCQSQSQSQSQCRITETQSRPIPGPNCYTQKKVDPPNLSSQPDLGSGIGGPGAGGRSGKFAGSTAPKRGRGILNQAGGPGSRQPLCGHCNSYVRGPFITALGQIWCPDHFVCVNSQCRRALQDIGFVEEKGQLHCEYCFERFIAPGCNKCNNKIKGDCLNAIGKHYHPECFNCSYCGKLFGNSPFFLEEGLPYCETDWNELFTTKCYACGFPVEAGDRWVEALNNNYHSQCFNCTMCKKNLEGQSFYAKGGRPFCKNHAR